MMYHLLSFSVIPTGALIARLAGSLWTAVSGRFGSPRCRSGWIVWHGGGGALLPPPIYSPINSPFPLHFKKLDSYLCESF